MMLDANIFNQLPGYIGWKDIYFKHQGCNLNLARALGLQHIEEIIGLTDSCFQPQDENQIQFHRRNDELAVSGKIVKAIHRSTSPYDGSFFYFTKKPTLDEKNDITGVLYHCIEFDYSKFFLELQTMEKKHIHEDQIPSHYYLDAHHNPYQLSPRELESLFFLLRGKTAKQIAENLRLSKRTVESYIEQIKNKFGCQNKAELLCHAVMAGYLNVIPGGLL